MDQLENLFILTLANFVFAFLLRLTVKEVNLFTENSVARTFNFTILIIYYSFSFNILRMKLLLLSSMVRHPFYSVQYKNISKYRLILIPKFSTYVRAGQFTAGP